MAKMYLMVGTVLELPDTEEEKQWIEALDGALAHYNLISNITDTDVEWSDQSYDDMHARRLSDSKGTRRYAIRLPDLGDSDDLCVGEILDQKGIV